MAAPFKGNQDYRGYLNYLGSQGDANAGTLLDAVGNDAKLGKKVSSGLSSYNDQLWKQYNQLNAPPPSDPYAALRAAAMGGGSTYVSNYIPPPAPIPEPKARFLDISAIQNAARASASGQAAGAVNPLYDQKLNNYLQNVGAARTAWQERTKALTGEYQADRDSQVKYYADFLANQLASHEVERTKTSEDTALEIGNENRKQGVAQQNIGEKLETDRAGLLDKQGAAGTATSGLGQGQVQGAIRQAGVTSGQQAGEFDYNRTKQELFKKHTFESLANSDEKEKLNATENQRQAEFNKTTKTSKAQFDLTDYLLNSQKEEGTFRTDTELSRQKDLAAKTNELAASQVSQQVGGFLAGLQNTPEYAPTFAAYGGFLK